MFNDKYWGNIHGDFHPDNILVDEEGVYVIDWDLAGEGFIWFDYLTLITHPRLRLDLEQRASLFISYFPEFNHNEIIAMFKLFMNHKVLQLEKLVEFDESLLSIVSGYQMVRGAMA